jgi:type I restriction enzyme S subunit
MSSKTKKQKGIQPKLRFPEFKGTSSWEVKQLNELANRVNDRNKSSTIDRVFTNSAVSGVVDQRDYFDKDIANKGNLENYFIIEQGDYVYNPRISTSAPVGPISKNKVGKGIMSPLYTVFRFKNPENDFYDHYFKSSYWHSYIKDASNTGARFDRVSITNDQFMAMPLPYPSPAEQIKIASCLASIDELIAFEEQKLTLITSHKEWLTREIFPAEDKTVPNLRFGEFKDSWKQKNLMPYLEDYSERVSANTTLPIYSSTRTGLKPQRDYYDDREIINEGEYGVVPNGYFVYRHMSDDGTFKFNINKTGSAIAVSKEYPVFKTVDLNPDFLLYKINYGQDFKKFALEQKKGGTRTRLYFKTLSGWKTLLPSLPEQKKIADLLISIDDLISSQIKKIEALRKHKRGLIQQLLPTVSEVQE